MDVPALRRTTCARIPTAEGVFQLCHYIDSRDAKEHLAIVMGDVAGQSSVLVRVHSECFTGDVLGSRRCDCGEQLQGAMHLIAEAGTGVILYLRQEGRGIGLGDKLRAYNLQDQGYDTVDANLLLGHQADEREYSAAAAILQELGVESIRLLTNNPAKLDHLAALGIRIDGRVPLVPTLTADNSAYLAAKVHRMRHMLNLPTTNGASTNGVHAAEPQSRESLPDDRLRMLQQHMAHVTAEQSRPFVTVSYAQTLNGTIGSAEGGPLSISGPAALRLTHRLRSFHDAILIGIGTVLADDPHLTVRLAEGDHPQPVVVDSRLRLPAAARLWQHPKPPWIATLRGVQDALPHLRAARLLTLPGDRNGGVHLPSLFERLWANGIRSVMVEGGSHIITSLLELGLADFLIVTIAPRFAPGTNVIASNTAVPAADLADVVCTRVGEDHVWWGRVTTARPMPAPSQPLRHEQPAVV
jgi:3,4-dihydroxy 2-butanone 4-phosphate synthase/GTP cyclohydrolase II